jgi:hypothetical protein
LTSCGIRFASLTLCSLDSLDNFKGDGCEIPICVVFTVFEFGMDDGFVLLFMEVFAFVGFIDESFV